VFQRERGETKKNRGRQKKNREEKKKKKTKCPGFGNSQID
jgi:hypothetical protein